MTLHNCSTEQTHVCLDGVISLKFDPLNEHIKEYNYKDI